MYEDGHYHSYGYSGEKPGCGEKWDSVGSDYMGIPELLASGTEGYFYSLALQDLPVYNHDDEMIGVYGGQTRADAAMSALRRQNDISVSKDDDLR